MSDNYELAVIGAGPAGMEAAVTASEAGVRTVMIDSLLQPGGQYYRPVPAAFAVSQKSGADREGELLAQRLAGAPATKIYDALTWGIFKEEQGEGWLLELYGPKAPKQVHARRLVLANGAYDTPVAFPGWNLPGVMTCGAALILLKAQRVTPATRVLVTGTGPLLLSAAAHLIDAGVKVVSVCETNRFLPRGIAYGPTMLGEWHRLVEGASYFGTMLRGGVPYKMGWSVVEARGNEHVEEAVIAELDERGVPISGREQTVAVDGVISGYSLTPNTGLARLIGCQLDYRPEKGGWVPQRDATMQTSLPGVYAAGDGAGIGGAENARLEGQIAGAAVALEAGHLTRQTADEFSRRLQAGLAQQRRFGAMLGKLFSPPAGLISLAHDDTIICRCEEITLGEVKAAVADGARTIGEVKMVTRTGMGNCQGRMCERSVAGAIVQALAAEHVTPESVGSYSIRPPLHPLPLGFLADAGVEG